MVMSKKMEKRGMVLCGANYYKEKYYLNPEFSKLPKEIRSEERRVGKECPKVMCVLFVSDVGGILTLEFETDGRLCFRVAAEEEDILFDEIGAGLKIREYQRTKRELLEEMELYYRVMILGETE